MDAPNKHPKGARLNLRITDEDFTAYNAAAVRSKLSLSQWIRIACDGQLVREQEQREREKRR